MTQTKPGVVGATIITRSGLYFDFENPQPESIALLDVAWGLSNTCRFGGHTTAFYSVAQHSVLVSRIVPEPMALVALMHDAAEAYVGDVVGPLKQLLPDYKVIERRVEAAVAERFGFALPLPAEVKHADLRLLRTEQRDVTAGAGDCWDSTDGYEPLAERIVPLDPSAAFAMFTARFHEIDGAR